MFDKISESVKELEAAIVSTPGNWVQGQYAFVNTENPDIKIWTANGVSSIKLMGNDAFNRAEKILINDAIIKSIALRVGNKQERSDD